MMMISNHWMNILGHISIDWFTSNKEDKIQKTKKKNYNKIFDFNFHQQRREKKW